MSEPWIGRIDEGSGRIDWKRPRVVQSTLLRLAGRYVRVKLVPISERSAEQLAYWFAVPVRLVAERTGYTKAQAHVLLVMNCFGVIHDKTTGRQIPVQPSTGALTVTHMSELIKWVRPWALKTYGLTIPPPFEITPEHLDGAVGQ